MDAKSKEAVITAVDKMRDDIVSTLQELVRIPSITGNEAEAQEFIRRQYEGLDLDVHVFQAELAKVKDHPVYIERDMPFEGRPNIIGIQKGSLDKKSIILNGHIDVVSPEPVDQWKHDPWGGEIDDNRLYGRGAMDMKSGLIANMFALKALRTIGHETGGTVMLQSVVGEETGGHPGALACFIEGYTADGMIVSEPSPFVCVALAGINYFRVKVKGRPAHAGQGHLGVNAIGKMIPIYQAIEKLDARRKAEVRFPLFEDEGVPSCQLIIGTLKAGDWPSTVAGFAEIECRIGFVPGENKEDIRNIVEKTIQTVADDDPWLSEHQPVVEWFGFDSAPYYQDPAHPFVKTILASTKTLVKKPEEVKPRGATWTEDTRFSQYFDFPAVSMGPKGEHLHGLDEYVDLDSLILVTKAIALGTLAWCSQDKDR